MMVSNVVVGGVIDIIKRNLMFYSSRFASLDDVVGDINEEITKYAKAECYYYIAEEPLVEDEAIDEHHNVRMRIERAHDDVRCRIDNHEVIIAYVRVRRAVVELVSGVQYWLILSYKIEKNDEVVGGE
jgi:hypothetical protein